MILRCSTFILRHIQYLVHSFWKTHAMFFRGRLQKTEVGIKYNVTQFIQTAAYSRQGLHTRFY